MSEEDFNNLLSKLNIGSSSGKKTDGHGHEEEHEHDHRKKRAGRNEDMVRQKRAVQMEEEAKPLTAFTVGPFWDLLATIEDLYQIFLK